MCCSSTFLSSGYHDRELCSHCFREVQHLCIAAYLLARSPLLPAPRPWASRPHQQSTSSVSALRISLQPNRCAPSTLRTHLGISLLFVRPAVPPPVPLPLPISALIPFPFRSPVPLSPTRALPIPTQPRLLPPALPAPLSLPIVIFPLLPLAPISAVPLVTLGAPVPVSVSVSSISFVPLPLPVSVSVSRAVHLHTVRLPPVPLPISVSSPVPRAAPLLVPPR